MANNVVRVRARNARGRVLSILRQLPGMASGKINVGEAADALMVRMGLTALSLIRTAFVKKADGGTDDAGESWPSLAKSTIAYSRKHPGVPLNVKGSKNRAGFAPSWMLTEKQRKRWWVLYSIGGPVFAWKTIKDEGAKTLISEYGNTPVKILRDRGLLLNSLTPGIVPTEQMPPVPPPRPGGEGGDNQIFDFGKGFLIIGTNRKHAGTHHEGRGHVPQRRLWPKPEQWPASWWREILDQGRMGLIDIMLAALKK